MRYIRFLKPPRITAEKGTAKAEVQCLITITSDLGDSFLPCHVQLSAELLLHHASDHVLVWRTIQWTSGMRHLPVVLPLSKSHASAPLRVRIGVEPKSKYDEYGGLSNEGYPGIVSAWSAEFSTSLEAVKLVERRFMLPDGPTVTIWEETGESIARHLWDAGIALSCHLQNALDESSPVSKALLPSRRRSGLHVLELGTGCGMVGITLARIVEEATVLVTDLPEAQEIVERNIGFSTVAKGSTLNFQELNWDDELPKNLQFHITPLDLVVAADCTYNPDSSPALVKTLARIAKTSPNVRVAIAMKIRHSSEEIFFKLMTDALFIEVTHLAYPLPGDTELGEETVHVYIYKYNAGTQ